MGWRIPPYWASNQFKKENISVSSLWPSKQKHASIQVVASQVCNLQAPVVGSGEGKVDTATHPWCVAQRQHSSAHGQVASNTTTEQTRWAELDWNSSSKTLMPEHSWRVISSYCPDKVPKNSFSIDKVLEGVRYFGNLNKKRNFFLSVVRDYLKSPLTFVINLTAGTKWVNGLYSNGSLSFHDAGRSPIQLDWSIRKTKHALGDRLWHIQEIQSLASPQPEKTQTFGVWFPQTPWLRRRYNFLQVVFQHSRAGPKGNFQGKNTTRRSGNGTQCLLAVQSYEKEAEQWRLSLHLSRLEMALTASDAPNTTGRATHAYNR